MTKEPKTFINCEGGTPKEVSRYIHLVDLSRLKYILVRERLPMYVTTAISQCSEQTDNTNGDASCPARLPTPENSVI
jgi:hypothetical protein